MGRQHYSCGRCSSFGGASARQLFMQSKREEIPRQKSTISLIAVWAAQWVTRIPALGINKLGVHSETQLERQ